MEKFEKSEKSFSFHVEPVSKCTFHWYDKMQSRLNKFQ